jgi:cytochrome c oxidase assembly factor CtaG
MTIIMSHWNFSILGFLIIIFFLLIQLIGNQFRFSRRSVYFLGGIVLLLLSLFSPLNYLGHFYLFSAHMIQHILLLLIVPPLLLVGTNPEFLEKILRQPAMRPLTTFLFFPVVAWFFGVGSMWIWHIPSLMAYMKHNPVLQVFHVLSLLVAGLIFAWPVFSPADWKRLQPLQCVLYLFTACVGCTVLGIFITFAPAGMYTSMFTGKDPAVLNLLHSRWDISALADQQAGGLIMWVPACFIYITDILATLHRWYRTPINEKSTQENIKNEQVNI